MSLSGGRSSVRGITDLSGLSPVLIELAGLKQKNAGKGEGVKTPVTSGGVSM
ncbi:MAG: hypothetical protein JW931_04355 [Methanomicrobiaceae archaeon]|nr:hypothetical protein [Methanomicrobiaceae archaeon]